MIQNWMQANGIRVFAVTKGEIVPLWQYHAEHQDGRTRSMQVGADEPVSDDYILDSLGRQFSNDD